MPDQTTTKLQTSVTLADLATLPGPFTDVQIAAALGLRLSTLRNWRHIGWGPPFKKTHGVIRYDGPEVLAWREDDERQKQQELENPIPKRKSKAA